MTSTDEVTAAQLYEQLQTLMRDSEALIKATASYADDKLQAARTRTEASLKQARERMAEVRNDALERTRGWFEHGDAYVRDNPWQSLGVAAVSGLLLGVLLARR